MTQIHEIDKHIKYTGELEIVGSSPSLAELLAYFSTRIPFVFMFNIVLCDIVSYIIYQVVYNGESKDYVTPL